MNHYWTIENGLAVLHEDFREPIKYNLESLRAAVSAVQSQRVVYATAEAWQRQLSKYQDGLVMLEVLHNTAKP